MEEIVNEKTSEGTSENFSSFGELFEEVRKIVSDSKIINKLSIEKIKEQVDKFSEKAKKIIDNAEKVSPVLEKAISLCDDLGEIRIIGKHFKEVSLICSMINDYICKRYTKVPMATVVTLLAAVMYFVSPFDIIPDFIPLIGRLDDMLVFSFVGEAAKVDIKKYEKWKKDNEKTEKREGLDLISEKE